MARRPLISIDETEVRELAVNLSRAPQRLKDEASDLFRNEADALHRDMRRAAMNHRYLPKLAKALTKQKLAPLDYEIGFETKGAKKHQGGLAHIIVFGSANNAPVYDFYAPLRRRTPYFIEHLGRVAEDATIEDKGKR